MLIVNQQRAIMIRYLFILSFFLLNIITIHATSFRHLSVREGLSSRQVFQINKDSAGFIWVFTHLGVDRYDGNEIRHYKLDETLEAKDHILSSTIMTRDSQGNIWIALKNGKIYAYHKQTDTFVQRVDLSSLLQQTVILNDLFFDCNGRMLLCLSTGIYQFQEQTNTVVPVGLANEYVNCLIQSVDGSFFAGTNSQVYRLRWDADSTVLKEQIIQLPIKLRTESLCCQNNKLYVGSFSDGVFCVDLSNSNVISLNKLIPNVPVRALVCHTENTLLIATDGSGVYQVDMQTHKLVNHYVANEDDERALSGNTVSDIYVDERNCLWITTYTNGISCLDPNYPDIQWVKHGYNNQNSLVSSHINVIMQDSEGDYWYGTNNGISLFRQNEGRWTHFLAGNDSSNRRSSVILALCQDINGDIWAGGYGTGTYRINKKTENVQKIKSRTEESDEGISTDYIYSIHAEGEHIWFGGIEGEFTRYNTRTRTYTYYPITCVGDVASGGNHSLLIAGCDGLAIFNTLTGHTDWHRTFGDVSLRYPIRCLLQASSGDVWLATDGEGLISFNPTTGQSRVYTTNDGLISNAINSVIEDDMGRIWFNTEKELYCLDLLQDRIIGMNEFFNISWGYYNANAAMKLNNGNLAFGTAEGVISFSPNFNFENEKKIQLLLTDFKLLYQSVKAGVEGSLLKEAINETSVMKLGYAQNSFSIAFSAINFVHPHKVRYEYKLENFNNHWEQTNNIHSVDYMNLPPGTYTFQLKAFDKYTQCEVGERNLKIIIEKPLWATWWAFMLYLAFISVLVYMFIQFGRHKINEYNAREKIRSFINIAHDIRTPISLIKAPLSDLQTQEDISESSRKSLSVASRNAERLFAMVTQLLDLQKADLYPEKLALSEHDIYTYMQGRVDEFQLAAIQKGLEIRLDIAPDFPKVWFDTNKMNNIIDNLLSNAIKYTEEGVISVSVSCSRYRWILKIVDTGIGIPKNEQKNLFHQFYRAGNAINTNETGSGIGLLLARKMIKQHRGRISFTSVENSGSTFIVSFPYKIKLFGGSEIDTTEKGYMQTNDNIAHVENQQSKSIKKNILLLAEDDDEMRQYLIDSLSVEYQVIGVADGEKALEKAKEINPDIIISDIVMPVLQGDELCRIIKSTVETSHIPVILLTALDERENVILGLEAGATDYIIKPFDFSVLKVRIRNILQSRQYLRETVLSSEGMPDEIDYTSQLDKEFLDKAVEIINIELANSEFSVNDFCRMLGMSRTSVYNKIKSLTDQSPNDFVRIIRLNKSKELLLSRKYNISEVSTMVGFSDPKYFSTCFKKQFGVSPSKV